MNQNSGMFEKGIRVYINPTGSITYSEGNGANYCENLVGKKMITDSQWHTILITWDGTVDANGVKLYVDDLVNPDVMVTANYINNGTATNNLLIGKHTTTNNYYFRDSLGEIEIYNDVVEYEVKSTGISLDKTSTNLTVGQIDTLTAAITPDNSTNKTVKWVSSDPSIVTVDENGKVTAVKEGTATITATTTDGSNLSASCVATVIPKGTTPTDPTNNTGNAILTITMTNGNIKSYTVSMTKVNDFISWYNSRSSGSNGSPYYTFDKTESNQPFVKKTEYIVFDKISSFEVDEYSK